MYGLIIAVLIMSVTILLMCVVYKKVTGGNFLKDLFRDLFKKE